MPGDVGERLLFEPYLWDAPVAEVGDDGCSLTPTGSTSGRLLHLLPPLMRSDFELLLLLLLFGLLCWITQSSLDVKVSL